MAPYRHRPLGSWPSGEVLSQAASGNCNGALAPVAIWAPSASWMRPTLRRESRRMVGTWRCAAEQVTKGGDIWLLEAHRASRLTFDAANESPVWSPDGRQVTFASRRPAGTGIYLKSVDGTGEEQLLLKSESGAFPS